ncbi:acyl-CoA thioesterase [Actinokineospora enzanensis]|uniref:acyl-CoA thioesterase n=1 Tax=Actinokineospora enzanensis TaxID=155975 RepID=UPI00036F6247|nr:acyl-CoA thioesterase [Actinokineospora enzanensis]
MTWSVRIPVRSYELDTLGHLNHAVYHQYAEVARVEAFVAAGCAWTDLISAGLGPVMLSSTINFRRELRLGDEVDVSLVVKFGAGKTFSADSTLTKADGTVAAEITCVLGLMDLRLRKLVADPKAALEEHGLDLTAVD